MGRGTRLPKAEDGYLAGGLISLQDENYRYYLSEVTSSVHFLVRTWMLSLLGFNILVLFTLHFRSEIPVIGASGPTVYLYERIFCSLLFPCMGFTLYAVHSRAATHTLRRVAGGLLM
ncbi:hypothetical protein KIPB_012491, partial [Kipferlia bialata]|eukprot:g12491.t1